MVEAKGPQLLGYGHIYVFPFLWFSLCPYSIIGINSFQSLLLYCVLILYVS